MSKGLTGEITKLKDKFNENSDSGELTSKDLKELKNALQDFLLEVEAVMLLDCF